MTALWTRADALKALEQVGGRAQGPDWDAFGVSIDSRSIAPGDMFVALKAARDGHEFVVAALAAGAAVALVSRVPEGVAPDAPLLICDDVQAGLEALGRFARARTRAKIIGVTGSVGKTSTKEMLKSMLSGQGATHAAVASYNNHWGVPLTLARMPENTDFAVIEMGMSAPGEILPLTMLARPHVAMITTVAPAHLEAFVDISGIAFEKAAIFAGLEPGGTALVNRDIATSKILEDAARAITSNVITFGTTDASDACLDHYRLVGDFSICDIRLRGVDAPLMVKVQSPGRHFAQNAVASLGVAQALGLDLAMAALDLGRWAPQDGRGRREVIIMDAVEDHLRFQLVDDAFNANPLSMGAALDVLAYLKPVDNLGRHKRGRRIAILGDMLELGPDEAAMHAAIAAYPSMKSIDQVYCVGPRMQALYDALPAPKRAAWAAGPDELVARAHTLIDAGDVVLVKGSKGSKVSRIVDALRNLGHPAINDSKDELKGRN